MVEIESKMEVLAPGAMYQQRRVKKSVDDKTSSGEEWSRQAACLSRQVTSSLSETTSQHNTTLICSSSHDLMNKFSKHPVCHSVKAGHLGCVGLCSNKLVSYQHRRPVLFADLHSKVHQFNPLIGLNIQS